MPNKQIRHYHQQLHPALHYPSKASLRALCLTQSLSISSTEFGNLCLIFNFGSLEVLHFNLRNENVLPVLDVVVVVVELACVVEALVLATILSRRRKKNRERKRCKKRKRDPSPMEKSKIYKKRESYTHDRCL